MEGCKPFQYRELVVMSIDNLYNFDEKQFQSILTLLSDDAGIAMEEFLEDAENYISNIERGYKKKDFVMIESAAHPLKSNAASFGMQSVSQIAANMNKSSRAKELYGSMKEVKDLKKAFSYAREQMAKLTA